MPRSYTQPTPEEPYHRAVGNEQETDISSGNSEIHGGDFTRLRVENCSATRCRKAIAINKPTSLAHKRHQGMPNVVKMTETVIASIQEYLPNLVEARYI